MSSQSNIDQNPNKQRLQSFHEKDSSIQNEVNNYKSRGSGLNANESRKLPSIPLNLIKNVDGDQNQDMGVSQKFQQTVSKYLSQTKKQQETGDLPRQPYNSISNKNKYMPIKQNYHVQETTASEYQKQGTNAFNSKLGIMRAKGRSQSAQQFNSIDQNQFKDVTIDPNSNQYGQQHGRQQNMHNMPSRIRPSQILLQKGDIKASRKYTSQTKINGYIPSVHEKPRSNVTERKKLISNQKQKEKYRCKNKKCRLCNKLKPKRLQAKHEHKPPLPYFPSIHRISNDNKGKLEPAKFYPDYYNPNLNLSFKLSNKNSRTKIKQLLRQQQKGMLLMFQNQLSRRAKEDSRHRIKTQADYQIPNGINQPKRNIAISKKSIEQQMQDQRRKQQIQEIINNISDLRNRNGQDRNQGRIYEIDGKFYQIIQQQNGSKKQQNIVTRNGRKYKIVYEPLGQAQHIQLPSKLQTLDEHRSPGLSLSKQQLKQRWFVSQQQAQKQRLLLNAQVQNYINEYHTVYYNQKQNEERMERQNLVIKINNERMNRQNSQRTLKSVLVRQPQNRNAVVNKLDNQIMDIKYKKIFTNQKQIRQQSQEIPHLTQISSIVQKCQQLQGEVQVYSIKFPEISELQSRIDSYQSLTGQLSATQIQTLKKSKDYIRQYSQKPGSEFLYFGNFDHVKKQRKGYGVLVTKKFILEGVWLKGQILRGAELRPHSLYKGQFKANKKQGEGTCKWLNGQEYMGEWSNGLRNGHGFWKNKNGEETYTGQWKNGKVHGYGEYSKKGHYVYNGKFQNFIKNGHGVQKFQNGDKFQGQFINGYPQRHGVYTWYCGLVYDGQFKKGLRLGNGKLYKKGLFELEGTFQNERPHGICQLKLSNKDVFNGKFVYGNKYGYGKIQYNGTNYIEEGFWNHQMLQQKIIGGSPLMG